MDLDNSPKKLYSLGMDIFAYLGASNRGTEIDMSTPVSTPLFQVCIVLKADFRSVEFSDWTGNPLLMWESVTVNLNRMLRMSKILLSKIQAARKIPPSENQPLRQNEVIKHQVYFLAFKFIPCPHHGFRARSTLGCTHLTKSTKNIAICQTHCRWFILVSFLNDLHFCMHSEFICYCLSDYHRVTPKQCHIVLIYQIAKKVLSECCY